MAHNLYVDANGNAAMAYAGARPWHSLGVQVPGLMTSREALVAGRLDYHVDKSELYVKSEPGVDANGNLVMIPDILVSNSYAMVRRDTKAILGIVGENYEPVQNLECSGFFDAVLGEGSACLETVGALGLGERIWLLAKCPEVMEPVAGDPIERYLVLTTAHDGSGSVKVLFTNIRVVCNNTLTLALRDCKNAISVRHTKNVHAGLDQAKEAIKASHIHWSKSAEIYKRMASQQMNSSEVKDFLIKLFPGKTLLDGDTSKVATRTQNTRDKILSLFEGGAIGADLAGKTRYGMLNAITHFSLRDRETRTKKDGSKSNTWLDEVFGNGATLRDTASSLLLV